LAKDWTGVSISVLVGPGSNGGGGTAAARHLANWGGDVTSVVAREPTPGTILEQQLRIYLETPGRVGTALDDRTGLILDALLGYGLHDEPRGVIAEMISDIEGADAPVISLDVPSGRDGDTGRAPGPCVTPTQTLTLALPNNKACGGGHR
jgi:NAD(P)H-hydrate epimerase